MKKYIILSVIAVMSMAVTFTSCSKYEDGPKFSLLPKKARLVNTWKIEKVTVNGNDQTSAYAAILGQSYTMEIKKDETYTVTGNFGTDSGTWELGEDKDDVRFLSSQANSTETSYRILRLKSKELWWKHTESNGDEVITHFIPN